MRTHSFKPIYSNSGIIAIIFPIRSSLVRKGKAPKKSSGPQCRLHLQLIDFYVNGLPFVEETADSRDIAGMRIYGYLSMSIR